MSTTEIAWTQSVWNPVRGCQRVSPGCGGGMKGPDGEQGGCYAETMAARLVRMGGYEWSALKGMWVEDHRKKSTPASRANADKYKPLVRINKAGEARWTGKFAFDEEKLSEPIRRMTATMYFVNSMSDLFGEGLTNEQIAAVFGVMAACPQHTFQVLTKRAARMVEWFKWISGVEGAEAQCLRAAADMLGADDNKETGLRVYAALSARFAAHTEAPLGWPLPNVWLGVSCERQQEADERIPLLLRCPATVRWVSAEPLLGPVDLSNYLDRGYESGGPQGWADLPSVDWVVGGGESGHGARPCAMEWLRGLARQCKAAGTPYFNKQLGAHYIDAENGVGGYLAAPPPEYGNLTRRLKDKKGADPAEWPEDLRVREWPHGFTPPKSRSLPLARGAQ